MYKDSDVFALENYINQVLQFSEWKDPYQIDIELKNYNPDTYYKLVTNRCNRFSHPKYSIYNDDPSAHFLDAIVERLCFLFPMKYEKNTYQASSSFRTYIDNDGNPIHPQAKVNLYRRKLAH